MGFSPGTPVSSTNKTDRRQITENIVESGVKHNNPKPITLHDIASTFYNITFAFYLLNLDIKRGETETMSMNEGTNCFY